jgi:AraC family transcriptional activator of pobA
MGTAISKTIIKQQSFNELLTLWGESPYADGFHIMEHRDDIDEKCPHYPFRSDHFSILITTGGESNVRIDMIAYTLKVNHVMIIPPNAIRQFIGASPDFRCTVIVFTQRFLSEAGMSLKHIDMFSFFSSNASPHIQLSHQEADLLRGMLYILKQKEAENRPTIYNTEIVKHSFLAFIYQFGEVYQRNNYIGEIKLTKKADLTMRFTKILTEHFREERSVLYYARLLFVTPRYLTQTIKEITGKTAGELIDEMVIKEAKIHLNNMSVSIGQVAESLYFSDQFFFSKFFKKHAGMTPSEYRKTA